MSITAYHERTKHHPHRYARSLGYLDWASQPDPFRTFVGATSINLPLLADVLPTRYDDLYCPDTVMPHPLAIDTVAILFELALGLSAWKEYQGNRWALRCNPSSGNLHPTEGYVIVPKLPGLDAGVYHYVSRDHCLEQRCQLDGDAGQRLAGALGPQCFLVGLSSIHWREAWKYGERAFRYCQHDVGHALAAIRYAAACLGWSAQLEEELADEQRAALMGLDREADFAGIDPADREHPDLVLRISTGSLAKIDWAQFPWEAWRTNGWQGKSNRLSPTHVPWRVIDEAAQVCWKPATPPGEMRSAEFTSLAPRGNIKAATLIRQRRSCLGLDGATSISSATFFHMLYRLLPRTGVAPWDALVWPAQIHLGIFVHRVQGLPAGLYLLERSENVHNRLRTAMKKEFLWQTVPGSPEYLRLSFLAAGDFRKQSEMISCHQDIAADGAFSLGMLADFGSTIRKHGDWWYRRLFWEAGVVGQVLYLEAEAAGVRSTGIGCYFDDAFHDLLGLTGDEFQDLYHFTVGSPVDDPRLTTLPPYGNRAAT